MLAENVNQHAHAGGMKRAGGAGGAASAKRRRRSGGPEAAFDELVSNPPWYLSLGRCQISGRAKPASLLPRRPAMQLAEAGCELSSSREGQEYEVADPRKLRRHLEQRLTLDGELRSNFLAGLEEHISPADVLHAALKPMRVTSLVGAQALCPPGGHV